MQTNTAIGACCGPAQELIKGYERMVESHTSKQARINYDAFQAAIMLLLLLYQPQTSQKVINH
jgi:hypothetical protein